MAIDLAKKYKSKILKELLLWDMRCAKHGYKTSKPIIKLLPKLCYKIGWIKIVNIASDKQRYEELLENWLEEYGEPAPFFLNDITN